MLRLLKNGAALCCLGAMLIVAEPVSASAPTVPVKVTTCEFAARVGSLEIVFHNTGEKEIKEVNFAIVTNSGVLMMADHQGSFAPGSETRRRSPLTEALFAYNPAIKCVATRITFADGTTWQHPTIGSEMEHVLSQTAGSRASVLQCFAADDYYMGPQVHFSFRNDAGQPATQLDLGFLENGTLIWRHADVGTFSPGVRIDQTFTAVSGVVSSDVLRGQCVVLGVTYADGTSWSNPNTPMIAPWPRIAGSLNDSGGQISTLSCRIDNGSSGGRNWYVRYRNEGPLSTSAVDYVLVKDGAVFGAGRELHNVSAQDEFSSRLYSPSEKDDLKDAKCIPARVEYADGSEWINPILASP